MTTKWNRMRLRPWARSAALPALPLLVCALLVSCSVPDGPNPGDTATLPADSTTADASPPDYVKRPRSATAGFSDGVTSKAKLLN